MTDINQPKTMKPPKHHNKFMELKAVNQHLMNGVGENAHMLFYQCKKCGEVIAIKTERWDEEKNERLKK